MLCQVLIPGIAMALAQTLFWRWLRVLSTGITQSTCGCMAVTKWNKKTMAQFLWVGDTETPQTHVTHEPKWHLAYLWAGVLAGKVTAAPFQSFGALLSIWSEIKFILRAMLLAAAVHEKGTFFLFSVFAFILIQKKHQTSYCSNYEICHSC